MTSQPFPSDSTKDGEQLLCMPVEECVRGHRHKFPSGIQLEDTSLGVAWGGAGELSAGMLE